MIRYLLFYLLRPLRNKNAKIARLLFWIDRKQYLLLQGATIGSDCRLEKFKFPSEPYLIKIGSHVSVGEEVEFITHDGGIWVIRELLEMPGLDFLGPIKVGNNVFIGNKVIILPNVTIGDNVIVGAGAVVTKDIAAGQVVAGVPARTISNIDSYINRKKHKCLKTKGLTWTDKRKAIENSLEVQ